MAAYKNIQSIFNHIVDSYRAYHFCISSLTDEEWQVQRMKAHQLRFLEASVSMECVLYILYLYSAPIYHSNEEKAIVAVRNGQPSTNYKLVKI